MSSSEPLERHLSALPGPIVVRAPGRVNLIGEHTDYNGGYVLPFAIDRCTTVFLRPRRDRTVRVRAAVFNDTAELTLPLREAAKRGDWSDYLVGLLVELSRSTQLRFGFDGLITSDLPIGAGLSSSAALEIALAIGLCRVYDLSIEDLKLARLCQRVENEFVGTRCGIMDQIASLLATDHSALLLDTDTLAVRSIPLPDDRVGFLVVDTNAHRSLAQSAYNDRRRECETAVKLLRNAFPSRAIPSLSTVGSWDADQWEDVLPPVLRRRVAHVCLENARVLQAAAALEDGDLSTVGKLLYASHASLRDLFEVSTPELDFLVDWSAKHGAIGARLVGGGFGGATIHLVSLQAASAYTQAVLAAYKKRFNRDATAIAVGPGPGAKRLNG